MHVNLYSTRRAGSKNQCKSRYTGATMTEETWDGISHCFKYAGAICACHVVTMIHLHLSNYIHSHLVVSIQTLHLVIWALGNWYTTIWLRTSLVLWVTSSLNPNPITGHFNTGRKWCVGSLVSGTKTRYWTSIQTLPPLTSNAVYTDRVVITCWRIQLMTAAATVVWWERHITRHWSVQYNIYAETISNEAKLYFMQQPRIINSQLCYDPLASPSCVIRLKYSALNT